MPEIDMQRLIGERMTLTVNVRLIGERRMRARLMLGVWLVRLAAWVIGCNIVVNDGEGKAD